MITIIVPVYNVEKYLKRCIESILNQTYKDFEILLVDDGSPDRCPLICDEYEKKDKRVRVLHKSNGGLSSARNYGLDHARGSYIGFVDGDDYIAPDMYENLLTALEKNKATISICNFYYVDEKGNKIDENDIYPIKNEVISGQQVLLHKLYEEKGLYWVVAWNKLYTISVFEKTRYPIGRCHEDEFVLHEIFHDAVISCIENKEIFYVQRENSIMNSKKGVNTFDRSEAKLVRISYYIKEAYEMYFIYECLIHTIHESIALLVKLKKNHSIKIKYHDFVGNARKIILCVDYKKLSNIDKLNLLFYYISPYWVWKLKRLKYIVSLFKKI